MEMHDSALAQVRRANRSISRLYNLVLSSCGLTATQYVLLQSIAATPEISQLQLSEKLSAGSAILSRRLSCLRKKGLVDLRLGARGTRIYTLTPAGHALARIRPRCSGSPPNMACAYALGDKNWQLFSHLCDRVCEAAKRAETMRVAFSSRQTAD